jgi:hypothetical protein
VFNALEHLLELEPPAPPALAAEPQPAPAATLPAWAQPDADEILAIDRPSGSTADVPCDTVRAAADPMPAVADPLPAAAGAAQDLPAAAAAGAVALAAVPADEAFPADARFPADAAFPADAGFPAGESSPGVVVSIGEAAVAADAMPVRLDADETAPTPSFMQSAEGSFWQRRPVQAVLVAASALLALALAGQAAVIWRDELAVRVPETQPVLASLCELAGCRLSPLRRIESLSVDASGLQRIEGAGLHRLSVSLRNRGEVPLLAPALELTLTDAQGTLLARRVLTLAELGAPAGTIAPGAELPLQALLSTGERRISGYTVELFYP